MKKYLALLLTNVEHKPQALFIGVCVLLISVMGTSVSHVASGSFALLLLFSLFIIREWKDLWQQLAKYEKWLLISFILYAFSGIVAFVNVQDVDEYIKDIERYLRFLAAVPIYLLFIKYKEYFLKYLYAGALISGPFLFYIAFTAYLKNPEMPAHGDYHHIIFGSFAMLNVGIMLAVVLTLKLTVTEKILIVISMICGVAAALLSHSRGVWLVIPVYVILSLYYSLRYSKIRFRSVIILIALLVIVVVFSPLNDIVSSRIDAAIDEVSAFYSDDQYISSVGTRLAMWEIAIEVWKQHPILGIGPGDFDDAIMALQKQGEYRGMPVHDSTHNIYIQSLVNTGLIGLFALLFSFVYVPAKIVIENFQTRPDATLATIVTVLLFLTVGFSESWTLRLSPISVYLVYLIAAVSGLSMYGRRSS